jgi:hypothetical protein
MHVRYPRAAVATDAAPSHDDSVDVRGTPRTLIGTRALRTLWASPAMPVRAGRLIGVRLRGEAVEVALVARDADHLRWVPAASVLTQVQVELWLKTSQFAP